MNPVVPAVVEELLELKRKDGLSAECLWQLGMGLPACAGQFTGPIGEVRGTVIDEWVRSIKWAPRRRSTEVGGLFKGAAR